MGNLLRRATRGGVYVFGQAVSLGIFVEEEDFVEFTNLYIVHCGHSVQIQCVGPASVSPGTTRDFLGTMRFETSLTEIYSPRPNLLIHLLKLLNTCSIGIFEKCLFSLNESIYVV